MKKNAIIFGPHSFSFINFRYELVQQLQKKYNVTACGKLLKEDIGKIKKLKIKFFNINSNNSKIEIIKDCFIFIKILNFFWTNKPKIVISYTLKSILFASLLAFFYSDRVKFFCFMTGLGNTFLDLQKKNFKLKIYVILYKLVLKNFAKVYFQNKDDLQFFKKNKIIKKNYSLNSITGVNIKKFKVENLPKKINFLMMSRIIANKGIEEYFLASDSLKKKYKNVNFYFAGKFENSSYSLGRSQFKQLLKNSIINLGWQNDVRKAIKKCSIVVLPSYREGIPRSILEGMSMGRAIITTQVPGCKETTINNFNGYLAKSRSYKSLRNKMEKIVLKSNLIKTFGDRSRKIVINKFNSNELAKKLAKDIIKCAEYQE